MLDPAADEGRLWEAEHHIAAAEWRIICQIEELERLQLDGASTRAAEVMLDALRRGREAWTARRSEILYRMYPEPRQSSAA